jgi:hypothetical protein
MVSQNKNSIVSTKGIFKERSEMVILPLPKYERLRRENELLKRKIQEWRKKEKEEKKVLKIIEKGEKEYLEGKIRPIKSLKELR